jgi:protein AroM
VKYRVRFGGPAGEGNAVKAGVLHLGLLALGETPRDDVVPTLQHILGETVHILELGGLDGLTQETVEALVARDGETPVDTRLRNGAAITLSKERIIPHLIQAAEQLATHCSSVLLLCSGEFPALAEACPKLIEPVRILRGVVAAAARYRTLGLVGPASDMYRAQAQWGSYAPNLVCVAASPYESRESLKEASRQLVESDVEVVFLDDMGFSEEHRSIVAEMTGLPTMCATTITARVLREMI